MTANTVSTIVKDAPFYPKGLTPPIGVVNLALPVGVVNMASQGGVVAKSLMAPGEEVNVKVGVRLILGCDLHMGGYGN